MSILGFKKGDVVKCLKSYWDEGERHFTKGRTYEVLDYIDEVSQGYRLQWLQFAEDDQLEPNGWNAKYFKLCKDQDANRPPRWKKEKEMKQSKVTFLLTKGSLTLHYSGLTKVIAKDDTRFQAVLAAIRAGKMDDIPEIVDPTNAFKKAGIQVEEGLLTVKGIAMPPELNARILEYKTNKIPFNSLLKFWEKLQSNPSFHVRANLFKFLENHGHSFTEEGDFIGYRGVSDDFKDKRTGKFDNRPGQVCRMPRELVDDNPNNSCSHGLHIGGFKYAKDFGPKLVVVKVDPRNVVAVPDAYAGNKLRVCEFEVLSETQAALAETVVSKKGTKIEKFEDVDDDGPSATGQPLKGASLALFNETEKRTGSSIKVKLSGKALRKHKARYSNNHAKRGPDGKFAAKKRK